MQNCDHNIGFWEKRQIFRRKLAKIAEICDHNIDPWSRCRQFFRLRFDEFIFFRQRQNVSKQKKVIFHPGVTWPRRAVTSSDKKFDRENCVLIRHQSRVARFSRCNVPKRGKIYSKQPWNGHKIGIPNCRKIDQMGNEYANISHCKTLQNFPK
jgi:hypothetical protein